MITNEQLFSHAQNIRANVIRGTHSAASGHPGGSMSIADVLTVLYFDEMNIDPKNPKMENRDRLVLSKGHCAPGLYATLAEIGYFDQKEMLGLRKLGHFLQGHPDMKKVPGIDMSSGSLGQGLSIANGMAMYAKSKGQDYRIYAIMGDGEIQEGQIWEAAMSAAHYKLDNLVAIVDNNNLQIDGEISEVMSPYPIDEKFRAFGFEIININGHNFDEIKAALKKARETKGKPTAIIAKTLKAKGVSFMEDLAKWHGTAPNAEQASCAINELTGGCL
jgi:transketolase